MEECGEAPVRCLSGAALSALSALDEARVVPARGALSRDWRGLAALAGVRVAAGPAPSRRVLRAWAPSPRATLAALALHLQRLDRWDVLHDCQPHMEADAYRYFNSVNDNMSQPEIDRDDDDLSLTYTADSDALTFSDVQTLTVQNYDAFVLFADEDCNFADELINKMKEYNFKLCIRDDLLCGVSSEHSAVVRLISERCARLIVILSPEFIKSPINTFIIDYTQALGIERKQRKILPIIYKPCTMPAQLSYYFPLSYHRIERSQFWIKLKDSLEVKSPATTTTQGRRHLDASKEITRTSSKPVDRMRGNNLEIANYSKQSTSMSDISAVKNVENNLITEEFSNSIHDIPSNVEAKPKKNKVRKKIQKFLNRFAQ